MAEEAIIPGIDTSQVASTVGDISVIMMWVIVLALVGVAVWFIWYLLSFKKRVLILERRKNGIIFNGFDKAKEIKTKEGIRKWKLLRNRITMTRPPGNSLYHDFKGREVGVAFLDNETIAWPEIEVDFNDESLARIKFVPFTSEDRTALAHEFRQSDEYKKKRIIDMVAQLAPLGALVIIVALLLLFGGDFYKSVAEPSTALANKVGESLDKMDGIVNRLDTLINNRQLQVQAAEDIVRPPN